MLLGSHLHHLVAHHRLWVTSLNHHGVANHSRLLLIVLVGQWTWNERRSILTELHRHVLNASKEHLRLWILGINESLDYAWIHTKLLYHVYKHIVVNSVLRQIPSLHHHRIEHGLMLTFLAIVILVPVIFIVVVVVVASVKMRYISATRDEFTSWWICTHFLFFMFIL